MIRNRGLATAWFAGTVVAAALGLAAWQSASVETWAGMMLLTTCGVLTLSAIGAVSCGCDERPRFVGFATFGWGYFALARWYSYHQGPMPTVRWLPGSGDIHSAFLSLPPAVRMAHDAWALAFAVLGSFVAGLLFKHSTASGHEATAEMPALGSPTTWWRGPAFASLWGSGLVGVTFLAFWLWGPEMGAGAAFLLTWAVMGLAISGAVWARGRRREAWRGAASFGVGYLALAFSSVLSMALPTDHFLNAVFRPGGPTTARERPDDDLNTDLESRRVGRALHEPIALHFPEHTSLKIVLEQIKNAVRGPLGKDLVVYFDDSVHRPIELEKAVVTIDRANIPAEDALRQTLDQLGLTYHVSSGYVRIFPTAYEPLPFEEDPVMIGGHSLLALLAAAFGGAGAMFVAGLGGRHGKNDSRVSATIVEESLRAERQAIAQVLGPGESGHPVTKSSN